MSERAKLAKLLHDRGIEVPKDAKVDDLKHRADNWLSSKGWLVRLAKPASRKPDSPVTLLENTETHWLPDSRMAHEIIESKLVFVLGRASHPPKGTLVLDVPKDYNDRWPVQALGEEE